MPMPAAAIATGLSGSDKNLLISNVVDLAAAGQVIQHWDIKNHVKIVAIMWRGDVDFQVAIDIGGITYNIGGQGTPHPSLMVNTELDGGEITFNYFNNSAGTADFEVYLMFDPTFVPGGRLNRPSIIL